MATLIDSIPTYDVARLEVLGDDSFTDADSWPGSVEWDIRLPSHGIPTGWLCPRCGKINSPDMKQCGCGPERLPNTIIGPSETK